MVLGLVELPSVPPGEDRRFRGHGEVKRCSTIAIIFIIVREVGGIKFGVILWVKGQMREEFFADVCEFGFLILVVLNFVDFMSKFVDYLSKLVFVARFLFVEFDESFLHGE